MKYQEALEKVVAAIPEVDLIDFTREVTRIPSIHGNELAVGKVFATRMSELGMDVREMDVEQDRFNIVGTVRGTGGGRSLMLNGHLDTVGPMLGWTKDPYGAVLEDGKIYGQGISNMKASDTAMVYAAHAIKRAGIALKGDLVVALVVGECAGGIGTKTLMQSGVKTDAFLCTEPTDLGILTVHASSQYFRVNIIGRLQIAPRRSTVIPAAADKPSGRPGRGATVGDDGDKPGAFRLLPEAERVHRVQHV